MGDQVGAPTREAVGKALRSCLDGSLEFPDRWRSEPATAAAHRPDQRVGGARGACAVGHAELTYALDVSQVGDARGRGKEQLRRSDTAATTWIRRFYTDTGQPAAMESPSRHFPDTLKQFLLVRDRPC